LALWGLAVLLAITNAGVLVEARAKSNPLLAAIGALFSWIIIGTWLATSLDAVNLVAALTVAAGFGLFSIGGAVWARDESGRSIFLVLFAYVFLIFIAAQASLAVPPWPIFAVLLVLDLAIGAAAIYLKRGGLMIAALAASQLVLTTWAIAIESAPWPLVALVATLSVAALGVIWDRIDRRFAPAALASLFLGHVVAITAGHAPLLALGATHVLLLVGILAITPWPEFAIFAVAITAIATASAPTHMPAE